MSKDVAAGSALAQAAYYDVSTDPGNVCRCFCEAAESSLSSSWGAAPSVSALLERQLQSSVES